MILKGIFEQNRFTNSQVVALGILGLFYFNTIAYITRDVYKVRIYATNSLSKSMV